ncbi:uncharacterized protein LOC111686830 isoform X1 [Lucilia cuprina]|uniref:uncharacterized protein LOC111686830 isoform X1 n=2 Tax=Lucilia cuprina TaxID=7375 RepID=UPI001F0593F2|nr:uncharacterized protein LOC111686830 isoform X1 [Lucilia cuprina]XP_046804912.1 uncharacterized protein LOC111686830 isoform X1 [Lucilia cuprina]
MNPLNGQQQPTPTAAQYYITGLPPLTPATGTSILKSSVAATVSQTPQTGTTIVNTTTSLNSSVGSVGKAPATTTVNSLMDNPKFVTSATNYMPVLLTNQTLISTVEPIQQQTTKITPAGTAPIVVHTPVLTGNSTNTLTSVNANKPLVLTSANNSGNITYQVLSTSQNNNNNNNLSPVISAPNGTVSVLLTSSQTMATAGHVAAPIIIRNTPTAATTTKTVQIKQEQQLPTRQQQQQQHQQQHQTQQQQQKTKMNTFNPQTFNADILKQIVVGNPGAGATANLAPGTTLLKPTILQNKPIIQQQYKQQQQPSHQQQIQNKTLVKNMPKMLVTTTTQNQQQQQHYPQQHQLQQKLNNHTVITTTTDNSSQMFAALGMELVKANTVAQTVQKLPQVSLLQNSNKKSTNNLTELINEPTAKTILKNPHEIKVGNLNSEVSLIKKPNLIMHEMKTKETSLLKNSNSKLPTETVTDKRKTQDMEKSTKIQTKTNSQKTSNVMAKKETNESYSLLKTSLELKKSPENNNNNTTKTANILVEKQKSLLKPKTINKKSPPITSQQTSPRSQRSNSCNTVLKPKTSLATAANSERRHSEPAKIELVITSNNTEGVAQDNQNPESELKSDEMDIYFEDEEYLESSGDKLSIASEKSQDKDKQISQNNNELQEKHETTPPAKDSSNKASVTNTPTNNAIENVKEKKTEQQQNEQTKSSSVSSKDNQEGYATNSSEDDDVTILPMEEMEIEPIEIDDDEDDNESLLRSSSENKEHLNESLLCDEQFLISSSSSVSNNSVDQNSATNSLIKSPFQMDNLTTTTTSPLLKKTLMEPKVFAAKDETQQQQQPNGYSSVLDMLSNFNMLNWRERIGTARGTNLKFQLNEFNLIQLYEKSMSNKRIHTAYEKPIYERESSHRRNENGDPPTYYMCRRCNVQGPSVDFLAPEFCSLSCLKRDCRKRRDDSVSLMRKRNRLSNLNMNNKNYININNSNANITNDALNINNPPPLTYIKKPKFRWSTYMNSNFTTMAAPISLFLNPFPTGPNNFTIGMKLEAIDPENCALFCVCTIIDIMGYRLKLSFDGYDNAYDFWLNADSMDIFPPGWCAKTNRILQPPKGITANKFNWGTYLNKEKAVPAPRYLFTHLNSSSLVPRNPFKVGMHLEAEDLNDTGKLCVASVADVLDDRIRIHFDGWDDCYDIIVDINSPYIHPCGWHEGRQQLVVPPDCENSAFNWKDYIRKQNTGEAASEELFNPREPIGFKPNMRLEVVDPRNPSLIRPATVVTHKGHRVKLHLDGWPSDYCFWLEDDSPDLHPIGWCDATGHDLEPPPGFQMTKQKMPCPVEGCRGIGNAKKAFMGVHATRDGCPYAAENWRIVVEKPQRINYDNIVRTLPKQNKQLPMQQPASSSLPTRLSEQQILERLQMLDNIKTRNILVQQEKLPTNNSDLLGGFSLPQLKKEETKSSKTYNTTSTTSPALEQNSNDNVLDVNLDIAKEFLFDYGPRLQQNFTLWQKNFTFDAEKIKRNPLNWSTTEVSVFVELYLKCRKTATIFSHEDIDGESFLLLQQEDLTEKLGLKLGPAVKLYTCILQLRTLAVTKFEVPYKRAAIKK